MITLNKDAFSQGQIASKLWLCEELEHIYWSEPVRIAVLCGWYGILSFLLLSREKMPISLIRSFDIDPAVEPIADKIMDNWSSNWLFKAMTLDVNELNYYDSIYRGTPHLVINCAVEHLTDRRWFDNIPKGTICALQSTDQILDDHVNTHSTWQDLNESYMLDELIYVGEKDFKYPNKSFRRVMIIGKK